MSLNKTPAHDAPLPATAHPQTTGAAPPLLPLDDALHLLQADPGHSLADPGLARLPPTDLDRLFLAARQQAERNHEGILLLLDLMHLARNTEGAGQRRLIRAVVRHVRHQVEDQHRWQALADNAAYYRDNRRVAERVAARLQTD